MTTWNLASRRRADGGLGDFDLVRDLRRLRTTPADNLLAVMLSYWLGL